MSDSGTRHTFCYRDESVQRVDSLNRLFEVLTEAAVSLRDLRALLESTEDSRTQRTSACVDVGPVIRKQEKEDFHLSIVVFCLLQK